MVSNTRWRSPGELLMTRRISAVAPCCSCASARRFSRSRTLAPSPLGDWRAAESLASLDLAGFGPRRIGSPCVLRIDRGQARRMRPPGQEESEKNTERLAPVQKEWMPKHLARHHAPAHY